MKGSRRFERRGEGGVGLASSAAALSAQRRRRRARASSGRPRRPLSSRAQGEHARHAGAFSCWPLLAPSPRGAGGRQAARFWRCSIGRAGGRQKGGVWTRRGKAPAQQTSTIGQRPSPDHPASRPLAPWRSMPYRRSLSPAPPSCAQARARQPRALSRSLLLLMMIALLGQSLRPGAWSRPAAKVSQLHRRPRLDATATGRRSRRATDAARGAREPATDGD